MTNGSPGADVGEGARAGRVGWWPAGVKQLRPHHGLTAQQLAARCATLDASGFTTNVIANIETRRRDVSVDGLLVLAPALDVAPLHLLTPDVDAEVRLAISPTVSVNAPEELRRRLRVVSFEVTVGPAAEAVRSLAGPTGVALEREPASPRPAFLDCGAHQAARAA